MRKEKHSFFISLKNDCLFNTQFEFWDGMDWNKDVPVYFKRLNEIKDDRSFVILATSVLEYEIDRFLNNFIPDPEIIIKENTSLAMKINLIKAFRIIPPHICMVADLIKNIRNEFAHNLKIDSFKDADNSKVLPKLLIKMEEIWKQFELDMCYYHSGESLVLMFKDLWRVTFEALRVFETNVRLFRQETEKREYINSLKILSSKITKKRI
jgi:hypothetical protein